MDDVVKLGVIVRQEPRRAVVVPLQAADLGQDALQRRHVLEDATLEQVLNDLQQLLDGHCDALIGEIMVKK